MTQWKANFLIKRMQKNVVVIFQYEKQEEFQQQWCYNMYKFFSYFKLSYILIKIFIVYWYEFNLVVYFMQSLS